MERHTFALKLKENGKNEFRKLLGESWGEIVEILDRNERKNFSLWEAADLVFGYYESDDQAEIRKEDAERVQNMVQRAAECAEWISRPGETMRLMYHNFGIVRENKELIRHRMFMTKLKPDCAEEYKRRHDALVEQRGDTVDPGPDSNFSIWSAGGYIFGYNEIDTTMETEETPEQHKGTVAWETRQLGIMDWITNDCDWLTGEVHPASVRLAWHNR